LSIEEIGDISTIRALPPMRRKILLAALHIIVAQLRA
jgi:hypothetical protein